MSWFKKTHFGFKIQRRRERETPDGLWRKCDGCSQILYVKDLERNLLVCSKCGYHFRIGARDYLGLLTDLNSFEELFGGITSADPLAFRDTKRYSDRLKQNRKDSGLDESVVTGRARIGGHPVAIGVMDFAFLGGTLGSATGEKLRRAISLALDERMPLVIVSTSGGARMQEGILSLMQMAKTSVVLAELADRNIPFISILLNPTTAGVAASYAALGDVIISEPGAMIGFAGPRVIQQTINQALPPGFQRADFVLDHGMIDMIVGRGEMRERVGKLIDLLVEPRRTPERRTPAAVEEESEEEEAAAAETETAPEAEAEAPDKLLTPETPGKLLTPETESASAPRGEPRHSG
jgi:acetyl-CoA carboxylase carboxyl transferase subunit beta